MLSFFICLSPVLFLQDKQVVRLKTLKYPALARVLMSFSFLCLKSNGFVLLTVYVFDALSKHKPSGNLSSPSATLQHALVPWDKWHGLKSRGTLRIESLFYGLLVQYLYFMVHGMCSRTIKYSPSLQANTEKKGVFYRMFILVEVWLVMSDTR